MNTTLSAIFALALGITATNAAVMNITVDGGGNHLQNGVSDPALSLASIQFYSSFNGGSTSNNKSANFNFLDGVINNWNSNFNPDLPAVLSDAGVPADVDSIGGGNTFDAPAGYAYVVFHFGNGQAGAGGGRRNADENGWWSAWYLGGAAHTFTLPVEGDPAENVGGFSSARFFNPTDDPGDDDDEVVPDGGTTLIMLALSLIGLGGAHRITRRKA